MCRLFACVHSPGASALSSSQPLTAALGDELADQFLQLSTVHKDGWGAAAVESGPASGSGDRTFYQSTAALYADRAVFSSLADKPHTSLIIHERLASPGIALCLDNQQPFMDRGIAFAHNGTIGSAEGNIVHRPVSYRASLGLPNSVTMSDSKLYFEVFLAQLAAAQPESPASSVQPSSNHLVRALSAAIALLRREYPDASYNCLIQTADYTLVIRAHADSPKYSEGLRRIYAEAGWSDRIDTYFAIHHTRIARPDGTVTVAASSSGYTAVDSWPVLPNDHVLVISHKTGEAEIAAVKD